MNSFVHNAREAWNGKGMFLTWIDRKISQFDLKENVDFVIKPVKTTGRSRIDYLLSDSAFSLLKGNIDTGIFVHNAREIWGMYGNPGDYTTWIKQIIAIHEFKENIHYSLFLVNNGKRVKSEYFLTEETLRIIQLGHGKTKHQVQSAVAERTVAVDEILNNPRLIANMLLDYADKKERLELIFHSDLSLTMSEIAKDLGYKSAYVLNKILIQKGYLYKDKLGRIMPKASVPSECYDIKVQEKDGKAFNYLKWTLKGKEWIKDILG